MKTQNKPMKKQIICSIFLFLSIFSCANVFADERATIVVSKEFTVFQIKVSSITFDYNDSQAIRMMDNITDQRLQIPEWLNERVSNEPDYI